MSALYLSFSSITFHLLFQFDKSLPSPYNRGSLSIRCIPGIFARYDISEQEVYRMKEKLRLTQMTTAAG